ncbi:MAG: GldG family protein [Oscillospiraceae bacterium]|nr:GldG family protein [Oscillospiraceae bacterium]
MKKNKKPTENIEEIKEETAAETKAEALENESAATEKDSEVSEKESKSPKKENTTSKKESESSEKESAAPAKAPKRKKFNPRSFKHGTMSVVLTVVFIAAVVVVNVIVGLISERFDTTADLTDAGIYSLEENTEKYLSEQLSSDVSFTVLTPETEFESRNTAYKQINELLKKMEMASPHVSLNYLDLNQNPNYTSQFSSETLSTDYIVVESAKTGRHRIISPTEYFLFNEEYLYYYGRQVIEGSNIEQAAVSAMMYVSNDDLVRVAFTEGYGEQDSSALKTLLTRNGYEVESLNLTTTGEIDTDIDFVVMFAPSMDVDNEHLSKLDKFLDNGGAFGKNLLYFASAEQPQTPNIEAFLNDWGISVGYSVVGQSDMNYLISQFTAYAHLQQVCDTHYAGNVYGSQLYYYGANMRPVIQIWGGDSRGGVEQKVLIQTYDNAFLYPLDTDEFNFDTAESGVFNDAVAAYRVHSTTQELSTVAVFGSYQMADSSFMSMSNGSNADFFINMFNYISGKEDSITIKSKSFSNVTFDMNVQTATVLGIILCIVVPVVVIVLGIVIWVRRRHR